MPFSLEKPEDHDGVKKCAIPEKNVMENSYRI